MTDDPPPDEARWVEVDPASLSAEALEGLVEEFASRDGTDYGTRELGLPEKCARVVAQLEAGEVVIVFDREESRANVVLSREWRGGGFNPRS